MLKISGNKHEGFLDFSQAEAGDTFYHLFYHSGYLMEVVPMVVVSVTEKRVKAEAQDRVLSLSLPRIENYPHCYSGNKDVRSLMLIAEKNQKTREAIRLLNIEIKRIRNEEVSVTDEYLSRVISLGDFQ